MRRLQGVALALVLPMLLGGCFEQARSSPEIFNYTSLDVTVTVGGTDLYAELGPATGRVLPKQEECVGTSVVVTVGPDVVTFDRGICSLTFIQIRTDGEVWMADPEFTTMTGTFPYDPEAVPSAPPSTTTRSSASFETREVRSVLS